MTTNRVLLGQHSPSDLLDSYSSSSTTGLPDIDDDLEAGDTKRTDSYFSELFDPIKLSNNSERNRDTRIDTDADTLTNTSTKRSLFYGRLNTVRSIASKKFTATVDEQAAQEVLHSDPSTKDTNTSNHTLSTNDLLQEDKSAARRLKEPVTINKLSVGSVTTDRANTEMTSEKEKMHERVLTMMKRPSLLTSSMLSSRKSSRVASGSVDYSISIPSLRTMSGADRRRLKEKLHAIDNEQPGQSPRSLTPEIVHKRLSSSADMLLEEGIQISKLHELKRPIVDLEKNSSVRSFDGSDTKREESITDVYCIPAIILLFFAGLFVPAIFFMIAGGRYSGVSDFSLASLVLNTKYRPKSAQRHSGYAKLRWFRIMALIVGLLETLALMAVIAIVLGLHLLGR
ncbi:HFL029Cp [Eremothecium sinecaudum]|uniref:HFL029Cp n=1 Tax=Eremothecium sinecaudum TaxID=45286 RepID=A0A109UXT5_9SACH|nr:HFL029Cp [Eremothecium sinecaudum]AMD21827.1 HFL029Cp [Eremothecium sinecaudum]